MNDRKFSYVESMCDVLSAKKWLDDPPPSGLPLVYAWVSQRAVLGLGKHSGHSDNSRVNPKLDKVSLMSCKDSGKKMLAAFVGKCVGEHMELYWREDRSEETSKITSKLEMQMRDVLFCGKSAFLEVDGQAYSKVDYMDQVFVPTVRLRYGQDGYEDFISTCAAGDGDLWSRFQRHSLGKTALSRIIDDLCLVR
jgi:hypothetical protein